MGTTSVWGTGGKRRCPGHTWGLVSIRTVGRIHSASWCPSGSPENARDQTRVSRVPGQRPDPVLSPQPRILLYFSDAQRALDCRSVLAPTGGVWARTQGSCQSQGDRRDAQDQCSRQGWGSHSAPVVPREIPRGIRSVTQGPEVRSEGREWEGAKRRRLTRVPELSRALLGLVPAGGSGLSCLGKCPTLEEGRG